ncbi:MAG: hypothetical protein JWM16_558 [Verrucomicrobiales bacterium]|nr:hypothetical protein [Verrucomicrobiales bacterium]
MNPQPYFPLNWPVPAASLPFGGFSPWIESERGGKSEIGEEKDYVQVTKEERRLQNRFIASGESGDDAMFANESKTVQPKAVDGPESGEPGRL